MPDSTDIVGVLRTHLEDAYTQLDRCATYFETLDLADRLRRASMDSKPNRTTQAVIRSRDRLAGYLETDDDEQLPS